MAKEKPKSVVPNLRFPGFDEPWLNDPLSKVLEEHKLKNINVRDVFSVSMEYGIVNQIEHLGRSFSASDTSNYNLCRCFDIVYTKSPLKAFPFGIVKQCKFDGEVALSPLYGVFTPINPHVGLMIEAYFESSQRSTAFLAPLCQKGAKNTVQITNTKFLSGHLPLPRSSIEQKKISNCLASLDELIAAQGQKVESLKTYKRGLMQQLFPRKVETAPRLRLPEFQSSGTWKTKSLSKFISDLDAGVSVNSGDRPARSEEIGILKTSCVSGGIFNASENKVVIDQDELNRVIEPVCAGTLLISRMNTISLVGTSAYIWNDVPNLFLPDRLWAAKPVPGESLVFIAFILGSERGRAAMSELAAGSSGSMKNISKTNLLQLRICVPEKDEQKKIADSLIVLDQLISAEGLRLEAFKAQKQSLMQQLFPSVEDTK